MVVTVRRPVNEDVTYLLQALALQFPPDIGKQISKRQTRYIVLDFSRVTFVDGSSALGLKQVPAK